MEERVLYTGPIRLHILHHAAREPIYGLKMIEELRRQALYLKLYPLLPGLEQKRYLTSFSVRLGRPAPRMRKATRRG